MLYRMHVRGADGAPYTVRGVKEVKDDPGFDAWSDTTTLYTSILRGRVAAGEESSAEVVAAGIIRISLPDLMKQLASFRTTGPSASDRAARSRASGSCSSASYGTSMPGMCSARARSDRARRRCKRGPKLSKGSAQIRVDPFLIPSRPKF
jgi:hypothetical protein